MRWGRKSVSRGRTLRQASPLRLPWQFTCNTVVRQRLSQRGKRKLDKVSSAQKANRRILQSLCSREGRSCDWSNTVGFCRHNSSFCLVLFRRSSWTFLSSLFRDCLLFFFTFFLFPGISFPRPPPFFLKPRGAFMGFAVNCLHFFFTPPFFCEKQKGKSKMRTKTRLFVCVCVCSVGRFEKSTLLVAKVQILDVPLFFCTRSPRFFFPFALQAMKSKHGNIFSSP